MLEGVGNVILHVPHVLHDHPGHVPHPLRDDRERPLLRPVVHRHLLRVVPGRHLRRLRNDDPLPLAGAPGLHAHAAAAQGHGRHRLDVDRRLRARPLLRLQAAVAHDRAHRRHGGGGRRGHLRRRGARVPPHDGGHEAGGAAPGLRVGAVPGVHLHAEQLGPPLVHALRPGGLHLPAHQREALGREGDRGPALLQRLGAAPRPRHLRADGHGHPLRVEAHEQGVPQEGLLRAGAVGGGRRRPHVRRRRQGRFPGHGLVGAPLHRRHGQGPPNLQRLHAGPRLQPLGLQLRGPRPGVHPPLQGPAEDGREQGHAADPLLARLPPGLLPHPGEPLAPGPAPLRRLRRTPRHRPHVRGLHREIVDRRQGDDEATTSTSARAWRSTTPSAWSSPT